MGVNRNLLGGIALRDAIKASIPSATINDEERYIQFSAGAASDISISDAAGMVFKPNTRYTFILCLYKISSTNNKASNLSVGYTDSTSSTIPNLSSLETKETIVFTSSSGKTIASFAKLYEGSTTRVYYDESGIFEGVLTTLDFEPYQAWGITMSGIRRSLVEAALHDDSTVAAPIATFSTDVAAPAKSVLAAFSPIQDLHGYSNPWPAGGNKNLLPTIASTETSDVTLTNDNGQYTLNGTASANAFFTVSFDAPLNAGTYTWQLFNPSTSSGVTCYLLLESGNKSMVCSVANQISVGLSVDYKITAFRIRVDSGTALSSFKLSPTLVAGSTELTAFSPYSNICPISGRTGAEIWDDPAHGGTIEWNQLSQTIDSETISNGVRVTPYPSDGYVILNNTSTDSGVIGGFKSIPVVSGHKYAIWGSGTAFDKGCQIYSNIGGNSGFNREIKTALTTTNNATVTLRSNASKTYSSDIAYVCSCDLTEMFGAGNEPATIEEFRALFPKDHYAYNAGEETVVSAVNGDSYGHYTVTWQSKAGTVYGGTVDVVSGVLTVTHAFWSKNTSTMNNNNNFPGWTNSGVKALIGSNLNAKYTNAILNVGTVFAVNTTSGVDIVYLPKADYNNLNQDAWISIAQDVQIVVPLETPQTIQLTPTQIDLLKGANNLWQSENGDMTVGYWLHG